MTVASAAGKVELPQIGVRAKRQGVLARLDELPGPVLFAIAAVGYWGLTYLGYTLPYLPGLASPMWPPAGLAAVLLIAVRRRDHLLWVIAGIFVGEMVSDLMHSQPLLASLGFGVSTFAYVPFAFLINRLELYDHGLINRVRDVVLFVLIAVAMGFANGALALIVAVAYNYGDYLNFYVTWSTGSMLGIVLFTPFLVAWLGQPLDFRELRRPSKDAVILFVNLILVLLAVVVLFSHWAVGSTAYVGGHRASGPLGLLAPYLIVSLIVLSAWRMGPRAATLLLVAAALGIAYQTGAGRGPFAEFSSSPTNALYVSQLAFTLIVVTILLIAAARVQLSAAEARYRALFENAPAMYLVARPSATGGPKLIDCNRTFLDSLGIDREDALGRRLTEFLPAKSSTELINGDFQNAIEGQLTPQERELVARDGSVIPVLMQAAPIVDESGNPAGIRVMCIDLSDRRRAQRLELENQLVRQQQLALLGTLTAGIAHEVKNPLNFVINFAEANEEMVDDLATLSSKSGSAEEIEPILEDLRFNAEAITKHGRRALDIMMAMLALSRGQDSMPIPVELNSVVEQYASLAYHGLRGRGIDVPADVAFELAPDLPPVPAVEADLGRVILNLVSNACEAVVSAGENNGDSRMAITVSTAMSSENEAEIRIRDTGTGVAADQQERIFEPFFTTKAAGEGTGLGLAISRDIVLKHHGTLTVRSEPGQFTEFVVTLPAAPVGVTT